MGCLRVVFATFGASVAGAAAWFVLGKLFESLLWFVSPDLAVFGWLIGLVAGLACVVPVFVFILSGGETWRVG